MAESSQASIRRFVSIHTKPHEKLRAAPAIYPACLASMSIKPRHHVVRTVQVAAQYV